MVDLSLGTKRRIGMRQKHAVVLSLLLLAGLVLPAAAPARPVTVLGSLVITVTRADGAVLPLPDNAITGFAVIANPGLEKTIVQQLPPYTLPIFIDGEGPDGGPPTLRLLRRNLDTTVVLTNTTGDPLTIEVTIRNAAGAVIVGPTDMPFTAHQTRTFQVSDLPLLP
jgi:hypothetical protein